MNIIKPKKMKVGDTIGIIAPAGCVDNEVEALKAKIFFESLGYNIIFGKNIFNKNRYLAGTDEEKLEDMHAFFADDNINAIFCLRGGYGCVRLINKIDYDLVKKNPKIFAGYSDITALCLMFFKKSGLITYHAPMFVSDFGADKISDYTISHFLDVITDSGVNKIKAKNIYNNGSAEGILFGGNLATLTSLCGVNFIPDEKFILFVEELNEPVYKIDRMFNQLLNIEYFRKNLSGIILGDFLKTDNKIWLSDLFNELKHDLKVPILGGFNITHKKKKLTVPVGEKALINNDVVTFYY
ncbi:LD-carboxypeptidase [bacterium]|nr:LD-carboxypeptidase [bacterium]